ncbi:hypothetical protein T484DRAFT_2189085 [Baffinella frigidus]|nr:hypothetical protein T484DRAFT_2189085 [Cryptophyta sp. CCMP2293]
MSEGAPVARSGFGKVATGPSTVTVDAASLLRASTDRYDAMLFKYNSGNMDEQEELREYVVTVKAVGGKGAEAKQLSDWVPVALLGIHWQTPFGENDVLKGMADPNLCAPLGVRSLRREIYQCLCQSSPSLKKVPREMIVYGFEPLDQFTNVFDEVKMSSSANVDAWKVLGLEKGADASSIKSSHRKLIRMLHPGMTAALPEEEQAAAKTRFYQVQRG